MENFDFLKELDLPGVPTGEVLGAEGGWRSPNQQTLGNLLDKQEVMVLRGNKQSKVKFDKTTGSFYTEKEVVDRMVDVGVYPSMGAGMGGIQRAPIMKTVRETVDPASVDAFNTGPDAMETAVRSAIRSTPGTVAATGAFMAGMGAGSAPLGGPETPWGFAAGTATGIVSSMLASAGMEKLMTEGFNIKPDEREEIGMQLNPMAATIGGFAPTLLMFRPSGSILKTAAGFEDDVFKKASEAIAKRDTASKLGFAPNLTAAENAAIGRAANITAGLEAAPMTQAQALSAIAKGGLINMGIAQASSTADAAVYGSRTDPNVSKLDAMGRSLLFGNVEEQGGGGVGDRLAHAGKEFAIGAGVLHKPWALGKYPHNKFAKPAGQVKFSGAPTFEALQAQRVEVERANRIAQSVREQEIIDFEKQKGSPVVATDRATGVEQVKAKIGEALKSGLITQGEHDQAVQIAQTFGDEILRNTQLSKIGGTGERETVEGSAGPSIDPNNPNGVITSISVFARALQRGVLGETLVHEVLHPLYESLSPEMRAKLITDLVRERDSFRSKNKPFDGLLKLLKVDNNGDWQALADRSFTAEEMSFIGESLKKSGHIKSEGELYSNNGIFYYSTDGTFKLRNNNSGTGEKIARRLWSVKEFLSVEGSRLAMNRGKYDPKFGAVTDAKTVGVLKAVYSTIRQWVAKYHAIIQNKIGRRMTIDQILDHISSGTIKDVLADKTVPGDAMAAERVAANEAETPSPAVNIGAIGDILSKGVERTAAEKPKPVAPEPTVPPQVAPQGEQPVSKEEKELADLIANIQIRGSQRQRSGAEQEAQLAAVEKLAPQSTLTKLPDLNFSEGDAEASANPPAAKGTDEMLAKIGIKRTVASNIVQHRKIGAIDGFAVMDTPEKVTHAFRNISHMAQESIQMLVTDKNHKPLEIIRHTMSEPGASALSPIAMATQVSSIKGAAHVWITHNHPSGTPAFSTADITTGGALVNRIFKGMGVKPMGFFAQSSESGSTFMNPDGSHGGNRVGPPPIPGEKVKKIPIVERRFEFKRGTGKDVMEENQIGTYTEARDFAARTIGDKPGVIFLDKFKRPVGTHELRFTGDGNIGRNGSRELAGAFSRTGADSMVVMTGGANVPPNVQEALGANVAGMFQQIRQHGKNNAVRMVVTTDSPANVDHRQINDNIANNRIGPSWRSEGDAEGSFPNRVEPESRVGATTIKPLHAAPKVKFPIPADKLKKFGIDRGHVNQFSEHAVVGKVESPVQTVTSHEEAAMFIDDYAGHLVQGQTMILITDGNGKPLQVGLHMINSDTSTDRIFKPMMGVLAGQAISTPGAREAWFIRINNGEYSGLGQFRYDDALNNVDSLRNLLDGTGINFRGALSISDGRYSFNPLMDFDANAGKGTYINDLTVKNQQIPVSTSGEKHTFKITERRYSSRTQVTYEAGDQRPDATSPNRLRGRQIDSEAWNRSIEEELGKKSGIVFNANSGAITAVYPMTMAEMKSLRGTGAHRALLALADRAGTNWATIHFGDVDRSTPGVIREMQEARENIGRFLTQANVKADTVMFRDNKGRVQELDRVFGNSLIEDSQMAWKSEGDQEGVPLHKRDLRKDTSNWRQSEPDTTPPKWNDPEFTGDASGKYRREIPASELSQAEIKAGNFRFSTINMNGEKASLMMPRLGQQDRIVPPELQSILGKTWPEYGGKGIEHAAMQHVPEYFLAYPELRDLWDSKNAKFKDWFSGYKYKKFVKEKVMAQWEGREGFAYFMRSESGADKTKMDTIDPNDVSGSDVATILSSVNGVYFEINVTNSGDLKTAFPIEKRKYDAKMAKAKRFAAIEAADVERLHAGQVVRGAEPMTELAKQVRAGIESTKPTYRGSKKFTVFSEGDAQEFNGRAERAIQQDDIVGPEAIRGNFLGWVKSIKELANQHLYQHPFPGNSGDYEGDIARDKSRLAKHAIIDQVLAKLERQKGFNPMTLKPGMLKQLRNIAGEVYVTQFKEIARTGMVMIDDINNDGSREDAEYMRNASLKYHRGFIKQIYTGMEAGMISKKTGMELIEMANDMRSRLVYSFDKKFPGDGTQMSEGDAENMIIPGGAREAAMNARPKKPVKTYLDVGHGKIEGEYGNAQYVGGFKPEDTFLYSYDHKKGKFTVQNVADMANNENVKVTRPDDFAHGVGGNGIETGVGLKSRETGMNGRIEIDHENQTILVSAGQGRGKLDAWSAREGDMMKRSDALKEIRAYVEHMQKKGELPAGYKVEGYGFPGPYERDFLGYKPEFQERFSEGDMDLTTPNHQNESLKSRGFISNYADGNIHPNFRDTVKIEVQDEDGNNISSPSDFSPNKETHLVMILGDTVHKNSRLGEVVFSVSMRNKSAYFELTNVYGTAKNKKFTNLMYAEVGERLRRLGITEIQGYVIDEKLRPISARKAIFGDDSTKYKTDYYIDQDTGKKKFSGADVRTKIDPDRRLSEGDVEMPPPGNPQTRDGEIANHTDVQLAKRGFITLVAKENAKSMAGMKMTIQQKGYTEAGNPIYSRKVEGSVKGGYVDEDGTGEFHGVIEYNGENGLQKVADFIYKVMPGADVGDGTGDLDWIKVQPIWRNRNISTVVVAEVVERVRRANGGEINAYVVDQDGRPIKAINRVLGERNVEVTDNGFEETSPRDQFAQQNSDGEYVRRSWDVTGNINPKNLYSEGDVDQNYEGLAFSEADVRRYISGKPEDRRAMLTSLPDKKNRDEFRIMVESIRQSDFDNRPGAAERRAKQEARRQEIVEKHRAQGHPYPELAADQELNPPPTGPDPEAELDRMRRSSRSDRGNLNSEGDGENMRIPGGARDRFQRETEGVRRPKPIKFWIDVGHADKTDMEGEQNTYLWYATKKGEIQVISADELRNAQSPEGYQLIESNDIPTHEAWETHLNNGNIEGDFGRQLIMSLPHGRIDDRGDVTRISFMSRNGHPDDRPSDYEHNRAEIKKKLAEYMGKKADEVAGYDFGSHNGNPERFSEGDGENMMIPGGAREAAMKRRPVVPSEVEMYYTDIGHPEGKYFGMSAGVEKNPYTSNQYLWAYNKYGEFKMISVAELNDKYQEARAKQGRGRNGRPLDEAGESDLTHYHWAQLTGETFDHRNIGSGRVDLMPDGRVRMSWAAGESMRDSEVGDEKAGEIKAEAAAYINAEGKRTTKVDPGKIAGYRWDKSGNGQPERFSEGDAENGRFPNQERARGKIPNARVNNGETDLGFTLGPGEQLDSRGGIIRNRNTSNLGWGDIGHEPLQYKGDMFGEEIGNPPEKLIADLEDAGQLQTDINFENGLFAYDASRGGFIHDTDMNRSSHAGWLGIPSGQNLLIPGKSGFNSDFGVIPPKYSYLGRIEPAIVSKDGTVERRGRISLGRNIEGASWLEDAHEMRRGEFPPDFLTRLKQEAAKQGYELVDYKGEGITEKQIHTPDMYDVYGFGMKKDKAEMGISRKDFGPVKMSEGDAEVMRDVATRPIGEGKDGQARLKAIASKMSEGDEVNEAPFRIPNVAPGKTNMELAKDIVTARFFTGISTKAHEIAADFPMSPAAKAIANMIHARAGARAEVTQLDLPTSIMKERTKLMNQFFEIMDPLRGDFASMSRDAREAAYRDFADMVTGLRPIDRSTAAGRAAEGLKSLLRDMHDYRTAAGEKLGEVADYFPAVYDSIRISEDAMAFKDDAKRAYMLELSNQFQGAELEAAAEKAARELTMAHIRGESAGMFNSFFEEAGPSLGENSSKSRSFGPEAQEIMSKWQVKDPYRIISRYISGATKRAEIVRRLGDEGQTWRRLAKAMEKEGVSYEKIDEMRDLLKASVGIGREPNSRGEQTFIDLMGLYTAGSVMGRSFLNNMFEPGSMGIRSGNLGLGLQAYGETWARTLRNAARTISGERIDKTFWEKYAEHIGTMSADINDAWMNSHSIEVDGDRSDPRINWLTSKVYQSNLLQLTENAKLQASHAIGFRYLLNLAEMQQGRSFMNRLDVTESVRQNLRELGIEDADHAAFAKWMVRLESMDDAARMRTLTSGGRMSQLFETAITKFSMQSSVRAQRAHKPVFQDGPVGKTLFQLMSYAYSYAAEVNSRTYDYAKASLKSAPAGKSYGVGDRIRFMAPLMMAPLGIIAFRAMFGLKDELYPTEYSKKHENDPAWTKWLNAASFAGIFGPKVEMAAKYVMRDQPPGGPLGQAAIGYARSAKTAISNAMEGKPQDNAQRQFAKASIQPLKAAGVIGATAFHPVAGAIASQFANTTGWSNAMTEPDKNEGQEKRKRK